MIPKLHRLSQSKKFNLCRLIFVYLFSVVVVIFLTSLVFLFVLGYRPKDGQIEQYAVLRFGSWPSGATVRVDGKVISGRTPNRLTTPAGKYEVSISRSGYKTWSKVITAQSGIMNWYNYALLIPETIKSKSLVDFDGLSASLASHNHKTILVQPKSNQPVFKLLSLYADKIEAKVLTLPIDAYSHTYDGIFSAIKWSVDDRYVLVKYDYNNVTDWIVLDSIRPDRSVNISNLLNLTFSKVEFSGTNGNILYVLEAGHLRRVDLTNETISRVLVNDIYDFDVYDADSLIYTSLSEVAPRDNIQAGLYRYNNEPVILKVMGASSVKNSIATAAYYNEKYIAFASGDELEIWHGNYPSLTEDVSNNMKLLVKIKPGWEIKDIQFSPNGRYLLMQNGSSAVSYNIEYNEISKIELDKKATQGLVWLDNDHLVTTINSYAVVMDYDGSNQQVLGKSINGFPIVLTADKRLLYLFAGDELVTLDQKKLFIN